MGTTVKNKVYVIYNPFGITQEEIMQIFLEEGYTHNFHFGNLAECVSSMEYLIDANEVWTFGNCDYIEDYKMAVRLGCDIWRMA